MANDKHIVAGSRSEFLGISAAKTANGPAGVLTFRTEQTKLAPITLMVDRATLERLHEDIGFLLQSSKVLAEAEPLDPALTLHAMEFTIHPRLL